MILEQLIKSEMVQAIFILMAFGALWIWVLTRSYSIQQRRKLANEFKTLQEKQDHAEIMKRIEIRQPQIDKKTAVTVRQDIDDD